ncbi:MAG TPA: hypothetical protein VJM08_18640 [Anaerolineales bacterium]|nr:hypothetical protein [Anaerolineales bacterium]
MSSSLNDLASIHHQNQFSSKYCRQERLSCHQVRQGDVLLFAANQMVAVAAMILPRPIAML